MPAGKLTGLILLTAVFAARAADDVPGETARANDRVLCIPPIFW
jgi:hypothetical protein